MKTFGIVSMKTINTQASTHHRNTDPPMANPIYDGHPDEYVDVCTHLQYRHFAIRQLCLPSSTSLTACSIFFFYFHLQRSIKRMVWFETMLNVCYLTTFRFIPRMFILSRKEKLLIITIYQVDLNTAFSPSPLHIIYTRSWCELSVLFLPSTKKQRLYKTT